MERFFYGAFGSLLPDCILFYSKRFTAPLLTFNIVQYAIVLTIYALVAGFVARIFPYREGYAPWKATVVGITLPSIVSGLISIAHWRWWGYVGDIRLRGPNPSEPELINTVPGNLIDLLAAF